MKINYEKKIIGLYLLFILGFFFLGTTSISALDYQPLEPQAFEGFNTGSASGQLSKFLAQAFQFGLAIAAALAVIMIIWGGVEIMLSETPFGKSNGKEKIQNAIYGLLLALVSWLILYIINPNILKWDFLDQTTSLNEKTLVWSK